MIHMYIFVFVFVFCFFFFGLYFGDLPSCGIINYVTELLLPKGLWAKFELF